jgi:uncharacterized phage protein gp47/JayE
MAALTISVASPPTTNDVATIVLSTMAALSGVVTDFNEGSQVRTFAESVGAVAEQEGISAQALAFQALIFSAMGIFNIAPNPASQAIGTVTFSTAAISPPPATQAVQIPQGTLVQTPGGIQFQTTQAAVLLQGSRSINVTVQAVVPGAAGNVAAGAISQLINNLTYPLTVSNAAPTTNGANSETPASALNRLSAKIASLLGASPLAIANAVIGVQASGSAETVLYSTCYEPWVAAGSGAGSGTAGFTVYIDNGSGAASSGLIAAATAQLNGNLVSGQLGYRPGGVPFAVSGVLPIFAVVGVSGSLSPLAQGPQSGAVSGAISAAVSGYFAGLQFCQTPANYAYQGTIAAAVANSAIGALSSLSVTLAYASASGVPVASVSGLPFNRVILQTLSVSVS